MRGRRFSIRVRSVSTGLIRTIEGVEGVAVGVGDKEADLRGLL